MKVKILYYAQYHELEAFFNMHKVAKIIDFVDQEKILVFYFD